MYPFTLRMVYLLVLCVDLSDITYPYKKQEVWNGYFSILR
ncbi:hypothetical protein Q5A_012680 [Serratia inhibens PRI-2C]|nr:hypothetical protein Q5A_012680 [Serratia inhibens PRI-2C]